MVSGIMVGLPLSDHQTRPWAIGRPGLGPITVSRIESALQLDASMGVDRLTCLHRAERIVAVRWLRPATADKLAAV